MRSLKEDLYRPLWEIERIWLRILGLLLWFWPVLILNIFGYMVLGVLNTIKFTFIPIYKGEKPCHGEILNRLDSPD
jgi:hypothetical protein